MGSLNGPHPPKLCLKEFFFFFSILKQVENQVHNCNYKQNQALTYLTLGSHSQPTFCFSFCPRDHLSLISIPKKNKKTKTTSFLSLSRVYKITIETKKGPKRSHAFKTTDWKKEEDEKKQQLCSNNSTSTTRRFHTPHTYPKSCSSLECETLCADER